MAKRTYTADEKTKALDLYATDGPTAVTLTYGIPKTTVCTWALEAGVRTSSVENKSLAVQAMRQSWETRRVELAHRMGEVAELALDLATAKLVDDQPRDAKDATLTLAILVDKAQLLTGAATSRPDHVKGSTVEDEIRRLAAELDMPNPVNKVDADARLGNQVDA